jgi:DNA-binding protein H-NS
VAVKYQDGQGNTWTGRGRTPVWLAAAEKAGRHRDEFKVAAADAGAPAV